MFVCAIFFCRLVLFLKWRKTVLNVRVLLHKCHTFA